MMSTYSYILCTSEIVSLASVTRATSPFSYTYSKLRLGGQAHQLVNMNIPKKKKLTTFCFWSALKTPKVKVSLTNSTRAHKICSRAVTCHVFQIIFSEVSLGMLQPSFADGVQTKTHSKQKQGRLKTGPRLPVASFDISQALPFKTAPG